MLAMTSDFHGISRDSAEIRGVLARIARAGFSHIHWCHEFCTPYVYSVYEMLQIKNLCDELGLSVKGVHATTGYQVRNRIKNCDLKDFVSTNEYNRLAGVELIKNRIGLACILNTDTVVLHFALPELYDEDDSRLAASLEPVYRSFDELESYCTTRRIKICIENGGGPPSLWRYYYDALFSRYAKEYMGICFDTGHAQLFCRGNIFEYALRYNDRLFMIHADDSIGDRAHLLPFEGEFDWEGFAPILARSPYQFPVVMEPSLDESGDDTAWLKKAFEAGNRFSAMAEKFR